MLACPSDVFRKRYSFQKINVSRKLISLSSPSTDDRLRRSNKNPSAGGRRREEEERSVGIGHFFFFLLSIIVNSRYVVGETAKIIKIKQQHLFVAACYFFINIWLLLVT